MNENKHHRRDDRRPDVKLDWDEAPAAPTKTWRERLGLAPDFPLHAPTDVERAMEAVIADLQAALVQRAPTPAARDVLAERQRQVEQEGWTPEHDDEHGDGSIARAAAVYALVGSSDGRVPGDELTPSITQRMWPWDWRWFKPQGKRRNLVKAAALIVAEIERIDRAEGRLS